MQNKSNIFSYISFITLALALVVPLKSSAIGVPPVVAPEVADQGTTESSSSSVSTPSVADQGTTESTSASVPTPAIADQGTTEDHGSSAPAVVNQGTTEDVSSNTGSSNSLVSSGSTSSGRSGSRSGGSSSSVVTTTVSTNDIMIDLSSGAATTCPVVTEDIVPGRDNNTDNVARLQGYLNQKLGLTLAITGNYDAATRAAVERLQVENEADILAPWGRTTASGNVGPTTGGFINDEICNDGSLAKGQLIAKNSIVVGTTPVVNADATTVVETPASTETAPVIGSNTTDTNVAAIGTNTGIFSRFWNWVKNLFN